MTYVYTTVQRLARHTLSQANSVFPAVSCMSKSTHQHLVTAAGIRRRQPARHACRESPPVSSLCDPSPSCSLQGGLLDILSHRVQVLMLTREVEAGTRKCHAYLPPAVGASMPYGAHITPVHMQVLPDGSVCIVDRLSQTCTCLCVCCLRSSDQVLEHFSTGVFGTNVQPLWQSAIVYATREPAAGLTPNPIPTP